MITLIRTDGAKPRIHIAGGQSFPFDMLEAVVIEQDTMLVLQRDGQITEPRESSDNLVAAMVSAEPAPPGSVIVKGASPLCFWAVVHDLDKDPSWTEEWIRRALVNVLLESEKRKLRSIAMPLLGTIHGRFDKERFVKVLAECLVAVALQHVAELYLMTPAGEEKEISKNFVKIGFDKSAGI